MRSGIFRKGEGLTLQAGLRQGLRHHATSALQFRFSLKYSILGNLFPSFRQEFVDVLRLLTRRLRHVMRGNMNGALLAVRRGIIRRANRKRISRLQVQG